MRVLRLASLMSALEPTTRRSAGALRRLAGGDGDDAPAKLADALRSERWRVDEIEACKDASGKGPLHFAAWRGAPKNCEILIDAGCDVEAPATGEFSLRQDAAVLRRDAVSRRDRVGVAWTRRRHEDRQQQGPVRRARWPGATEARDLRGVVSGRGGERSGSTGASRRVMG